ncbi:tellurium resistance protein [Bosea sp. BIWAKO-01]|nr:tellurium resistance protein [Bosea sp. BIWAKO-01]
MLKGVASPSFKEISPIRPVLTFDTPDKRIVEGRNVVDELDKTTNLAALDWEDFEHVVRELFAKMFTARGSSAEVHVTRASRDYGVDALVHDPDPIHGGKFVIQAKRYVNKVEVSAVRDLYGTVQNEGANRGFLVTTSSFGPDAHAFVKGKPLTLIDGPHLLQLLQDHGYGFRINLEEARKLLKERE